MYNSQIDRGSTVVCGAGLGAEWLVRELNDRADRIRHMEFHIEQGDYFAVLATIINIAINHEIPESEKIFKFLFEDLEYLQENYEIVKKTDNRQKNQ